MQPEHNPDNWQNKLQAITGKHEIQGYLQAVIQIAKAERGFVAQWNKDTRQYNHFRALYGMDALETTAQQSWWIPEMLEYVAKKSISLLTDNALHSNVSPRHPFHTNPARLTLRCVMIAPIFVDDFIRGIIYLDVRFRTHVFYPTDINLLEFAADHLADMLRDAVP
jgi:hypothetical protein